MNVLFSSFIHVLFVITYYLSLFLFFTSIICVINVLFLSLMYVLFIIYYLSAVHVFLLSLPQLDLIHQEGCFDKLKGDVEENLTLLGAVAIGIGFVQVSVLKKCVLYIFMTIFFSFFPYLLTFLFIY